MTKRKSTPSNGDGQISIDIRLRWGLGEDLETIHINQMIINHSGPEFYVTFGELYPPPFTDPSELPEELEIRPRVRLAIAPEAMIRIMEVINDNVSQYMKKKEPTDDDSNPGS